METITLEALSVASLVRQVEALPHETRARITATEKGEPWAVLDIAPMTDTRRASFPLYSFGARGDTRKAGQSGAHFTNADADRALSLVVNRARRMFGTE